MKINVLTPIHGRAPLTDAVLGYYADLREAGYVHEHIVIATDTADAELAEKHGCIVVRHGNEPLGDKFNAGIPKAIQTADAVMISGSDAVVSRTYLDFVRSVQADWFCPCSLYAYDTTLGKERTFYFDYLLTGTGQVITRNAWEKIGMRWYASKDRALDASLYALMAEHGIKPVHVGRQRMFGMGVLTVKLAKFDGITPMLDLLRDHKWMHVYDGMPADLERFVDQVAAL